MQQEINMKKWKPKGCPLCGGDVFIDRDMDSWYEQCLQCSHSKELESIDKYKQQLSQVRQEIDQ
jgi:hypothetical protein